jgi:hypothetical protein
MTYKLRPDVWDLLLRNLEEQEVEILVADELVPHVLSNFRTVDYLETF